MSQEQTREQLFQRIEKLSDELSIISDRLLDCRFERDRLEMKNAALVAELDRIRKGKT